MSYPNPNSPNPNFPNQGDPNPGYPNPGYSNPGYPTPGAPGPGFPNPQLGNLAQKARTKKFKEAKGILVAVGVLTILANVLFIFLAPGQIDSEIKKEIGKLGPGMVVDQQVLAQVKAEALRTVYLYNGVGIGLGVIFIVLGMSVQTAPVPITATGLVLYLGATAVYGFLDHETLMKGIIIKAIIVVMLVKALQAAIAYQSEVDRSARAY